MGVSTISMIRGQAVLKTDEEVVEVQHPRYRANVHNTGLIVFNTMSLESRGQEAYVTIMGPDTHVTVWIDGKDIKVRQVAGHKNIVIE